MASRLACQVEWNGRHHDLPERSQGAPQARRGVVVQDPVPEVSYDDLGQDHGQP
jgi:hypothetical protein